MSSPVPMKRIFWPLLQLAVDDADVNDHAAIIVVDAVEDQRPGRACPASPLGGGSCSHSCVDHFVDALAGLGRDQDRILGAEAQHLLDFLGHFHRLRDWQIDLVDDGDDFQPGLDGRIGVGDGLGLHALGGIHHQHRPFAGLQGLLHFVMEIHVAGRVDEVEHELLAVVLVEDRDGRRLDGDAAFALQVHVVEDLFLELAFGDGPGDMSRRSDSVLLPWSMWAMIEKLRICISSGGLLLGRRCPFYGEWAAATNAPAVAQRTGSCPRG